MSLSRHSFAAQHYESRAMDYVASAVHSNGSDLDQIEAALRGRGATRVLDIGCGGGHVSYRAAPHAGEVVACDVTAGMLEVVAATAAARGLANISVRQAAAEALPFGDGEFDFVLCRFTAHHWLDLEAGLREALRVLAAKGTAIFVDTITHADPAMDTHLQAIELLRDASHVRNYSVTEWMAALSRAGFAVDGMTLRTLRMIFADWIARTRTPALHAEAIRSVQQTAPPAVRDVLGVGPDGSFDLQAATIVARAAA